MRQGTCGACGTLCDVDDPRRPWQCPACGAGVAGRMTALEAASKAGCAMALFGFAALILVMTFLAVFVY